MKSTPILTLQYKVKVELLYTSIQSEIRTTLHFNTKWK